MLGDEVRQKRENGRLTQVHWPVGHEQELPQLQVHPGPRGEERGKHVSFVLEDDSG